MKYKVKMVKIESSHNNLRTDELVGMTERERPEQGKPFLVVGDSLTEGMDCRLVSTTRIKKVRNTIDEDGNKVLNSFEIATENSIYRITYLD